MRIGIDARYLQNDRTGVARYIYSLLLNLKVVDRNNEYVLFLGSSKAVALDIISLGFSCDVSKLPTTNQILKVAWQLFYLPWRIKDLRIDVFHEPAFVTPFFKHCPMVLTVHDLAYKFLPESYTLRNRLYLDCLMKKSIDASDKVIAVSENTKKDILQNYKIEEQKIKVIHHAVDDIFHPLTDLKKEKSSRVKLKYGITGDFILTVSAISPRKNLVNLIQAYVLLRKKSAFGHQLVIAGQKGWLFKEVFAEAAASGYEKDIIFCGFVPQNDLVFLYNTADVFVYPSLYEGFGLPLLEAMACNCPVVASNRSSIPEVCSDAAFLVNPDNPAEFADAISRIISDPLLKKSLVDQGMMRARVFSWKKTAEDTLNVYNSLI